MFFKKKISVSLKFLRYYGQLQVVHVPMDKNIQQNNYRGEMVQ